MGRLKEMHEEYCEKARDFARGYKDVYDEYEMIQNDDKNPIEELTFELKIEYA